MKFLHISDLHIGKRVNEFSMLEDQKYILNQILAVAEETKAEGVIIAGDIYDRQVPSAEAVQVLDAFLTGLAQKGKLVFAVSGNHDSPERIAFGAQLLKDRGVYFSPVYNGKTTELILRDEYGEISIFLLPFVKPAILRQVLEAEGKETLVENSHDAVRIAIERMKVDTTRRNLLVAHQFVTGAGRCDSEETTAGGLDNVDASVFDAFDYVALGHIHSPQYVGKKTLRYCGTPLKYSFSEAEQEKSVTLVELKEKGEIALSQIPLAPLHDMCRIRGTYEQVMSRKYCPEKSREDYVKITLTDEEDVPDAAQRLRTVYPNLMALCYDNSRTRRNQTIEAPDQMEQKTEMELFSEFFALLNNQPMSREQASFVRGVIEEAGKRL